jgi:cysteine desulfurase
LRESRQKLADFLGCSVTELVFTGGATESNNTILRALFQGSKNTARNEFITSKVEHPSVLKTLQDLETQGAVVHYISVDRDGELNWSEFMEALSPRTCLVSMMFANNETGVLFPLKKIIKASHEAGALVHSDMVQAMGKVPVILQDMDLDYASFSAHKFYSIKGSGLIYLKRSSPFRSLITGGNQERSRRGGTENTLGILAYGVAAEEKNRVQPELERLETLRDLMESEILSKISGVTITGANSKRRLANTSSMVISGVDGETLLMSLDLKNYAVSTGAACSSGNPEPSPVLLTMGLSRLEAQSSLRVSMGWDTTEVEINQFIATLIETVSRLRGLNQEGLKHG